MPQSQSNQSFRYTYLRKMSRNLSCRLSDSRQSSQSNPEALLRHQLDPDTELRRSINQTRPDIPPLQEALLPSQYHMDRFARRPAP